MLRLYRYYGIEERCQSANPDGISVILTYSNTILIYDTATLSHPCHDNVGGHTRQSQS